MALVYLAAPLAAHRTAFVDTKIFVYLLEEHPRYAAPAATVLSAIEQDALAGVTSMLTMAARAEQRRRGGDSPFMLTVSLAYSAVLHQLRGDTTSLSTMLVMSVENL